jgi:hypothetical protein
LPNDVHSVQIQLPDDFEPEEIHTALAHEVAAEMGMDASAIRLAAVKASQFCMGGEENTLLTSVFETQQLVQYDQACRKAGLVFDGVGAVELAVLNGHARREPNARLLLLRAHSGFYAGPATEVAPFGTYAVSFGVESQEDAVRDTERISRMARQFRHSHTPVHIWCTHALSATRKEQLQDAFGTDVALQYVDFADMVTPISTHAAWQHQVGRVTCGCALVGMRKTPKSPYRVGTWLFLAIVVMTAAYIGLRWQTFRRQLAATEQRTYAWNELEQERKSLNAQVTQLRETQSRCVAMEQLMGEPVVPAYLGTVLATLAEHMPPYTRITSIVETADRHCEIRGTTQFQEGLIELNQALGEALRPHSLVVEPGQVKQAARDAQRERQFVCRIFPQGRPR